MKFGYFSADQTIDNQLREQNALVLRINPDYSTNNLNDENLSQFILVETHNCQALIDILYDLYFVASNISISLDIYHKPIVNCLFDIAETLESEEKLFIFVKYWLTQHRSIFVHKSLINVDSKATSLHENIKQKFMFLYRKHLSDSTDLQPSQFGKSEFCLYPSSSYSSVWFNSYQCETKFVKIANAKGYMNEAKFINANPRRRFAPRRFHYLGMKTLEFEQSWIKEKLRETSKYLSDLRSNRTKDICVIVGNGPSLNKTNLELLNGFDVFISNFAVMDDFLRSKAKFVCLTNYLVAEQGKHFFNSLDNIVLSPFWMAYCLSDSSNKFFFNAVGGEEFFSTQAAKYVSWHSTVTYFMLQIAYAIGYSKVLLIGVDNSYKQKQNLKEGDLINQGKEDDQNHFIPNYFKGKTWQAADTDKMASVYHLANHYYNNAKRKIVNCTVGGALEVFERSTLEAELDMTIK